MKTKKLRGLSTSIRRMMAAAVMAMAATTASATTWFVGSSQWTGKPEERIKTTLNEAYTAATTGDTIWMAAGTYSEPSITLSKAKVYVYGGFVGTENAIADRAKVSNGKPWEFVTPTVINNTGAQIFLSSGSNSIEIDGITFDGQSTANRRALSLTAGTTGTSHRIANCIAKNYRMNSDGSSMNIRCKADIVNCLITNNETTSGSGGGIYIDYTVVVDGCEITNNQCSNGGGGIGANYADGASPVVRNCVIKNNTAINGSGGGIYGERVTVYNTLIANNTATRGGGLALRARTAANHSTVYNVTIVNNHATNTDGSGGIVFNAEAAAVACNLFVYNSILYNNTNGINEVVNVVNLPNGTNYYVPNRKLQNCLLDRIDYANITITDCLASTDGNVIFTDATNGDYTLKYTSPARDAGTNDAISLPATDIVGNTRSSGSAVDIGAYEWTPASNLTLSALTLNGTTIADFANSRTNYHVRLNPATPTYPAIVPTAADAGATVSTITFIPAEFNPAVGDTARFVVSSGENSLTYIITFALDSMIPLSELMMERIRAEKESTINLTELIPEVQGYLSLINLSGRCNVASNGFFTDIDYANTQGNSQSWLAQQHLDRILRMTYAYTMAESPLHNNADLYNAIQAGMAAWTTTHPTQCTNWWYNQIAEPKALGLIAIQMRGTQPLSEAVEDAIITRMYNQSQSGYPGTGSATSSANKIDVAEHGIYSALLNCDEDRLRTMFNTFIYPSVMISENTNSDGIKPDHSHMMHDRVLYIGGYGEVFIEGMTYFTTFTHDTKYAMPSDKVAILSEFVRNTWMNAVRGRYMLWDVTGRGVSRIAELDKSIRVVGMQRMKVIDPEHSSEYDAAISRLSEQQSASHGVAAMSRQHFIADHTLHVRPSFTFDVNYVSTRTRRIEWGNGENRKALYMSDGCTNIVRRGDEYATIFGVWNWARIPGVTNLQTPDQPTINEGSTTSVTGTATIAGGVTDEMYSVTAYAYPQDRVNLSAKKGWFMFDDEVVCLGSSITARQGAPHDSYETNTTLNQSNLHGEVALSQDGSAYTTLAMGEHTYTDAPKWVLHDSIGYVFPQGGNVVVSNQAQTGNWHDINNNGADEEVSRDVFSLWFNHGTSVSNGKYAYIIAPNRSAAQMQDYYAQNNIDILANNDTLQAVYHRGLRMYGFAFYSAGTYTSAALTLDVSAACAVLVKQPDQDNISVWVADPQKQGRPIQMGIKTPLLSELKAITYTNPATPYMGKSLEFVVNNQSPTYQGKDIILDRTGWTVASSYYGCADGTAGGNNPNNILDNVAGSVFSMVKPSKSITCSCGTQSPYQCDEYESLSNPAADAVPYFVVDMQQERVVNSIVYRHRTDNSTLGLRLQRASLYGSSDGVTFTAILEDFLIATDVPEVKVDFEQVSVRYLKLEYKVWDIVNSASIQVSEFNVGTRIMPQLPVYVYVQSVSLPASLSLNVGESQTLTATITPSDADDQRLTWSSSATSVVSVVNGVVTAVGAGSATITVRSEDGGHTATCVVTVTSSSTDGGGNNGDGSTAVYAETLPQLLVRPNPARSMLHISDDVVGVVEIFDMNGALVLTSTSSDINISTLPAGIYIVKAGSKSAKVVKQ